MLINADAATTPLQDKSVHTICTSPPYWSLRKYSGEQERDWPAVNYVPMAGLSEIVVPAMRCALGLEPDVAAYIGHMVLIFRELYRVLRDDGVVWCVMGDSYAAKLNVEQGNLLMVPHRLALALQGDGWTIRNDCVWAKSSPMPESVSGWRWSRHKIKVRSNRPPARQDHLPPSGQRESGQRGNAWSDVQNQPGTEWRDCPGCDKCEATDGYVLRRGSWRHTRAHEFVLMCVKAMGYWSNQEVVREKQYGDGRKRGCVVSERRSKSIDHVAHYGVQDTGKRNPRSTLSPSPENYSGQHFAVFPTGLIAPLIRATTPARCCPACGAGWSPVVDKESGKKGDPTSHYINQVRRPDSRERRATYFNTVVFKKSIRLTERGGPTTSVLGYRPTCDCAAPHRWEFLGTIKDNKPMHRCARCGIGDWTEPAQQPCKEPGLVFDPFLGSGTTARVAKELGLRWVGSDLSFEYLDLQAKVRTGTGVPSDWREGLPMFADGQYE